VTDSNIRVELTDPTEFHCFRLTFNAAPKPGSPRVPIEIMLHTTQAIDLFTQLANQLSVYMAKASAELIEIKTRSLTP
jgi:hypothetical protein